MKLSFIRLYLTPILYFYFLHALKNVYYDNIFTFIDFSNVASKGMNKCKNLLISHFLQIKKFPNSEISNVEK